jgi:hypothetical protein
MIKSLEKAIAEIESLPASDQEQIGRKLLSHVEKLRLLRDDIDEGVRSLDAGKGRQMDVEDIIRRQNERYGRS